MEKIRCVDIIFRIEISITPLDMTGLTEQQEIDMERLQAPEGTIRRNKAYSFRDYPEAALTVLL